MTQRGSLAICAERKLIQVSKRDKDGYIYDSNFELVHTGKYEIEANNISPDELDIIRQTVIPGSPMCIQSALERLAQIKPIGSSEVKQKTVIAYLSHDLVDEGVSEFVVNECCKEFRKDPDNRFFPDNGVFIKRAKELMGKYAAVIDGIENPKEPKITEKKEKAMESKVKIPLWEEEIKTGELSAEGIRQLKDFLSRMPESLARAYCGDDYNYDEVMK